MKNRICDCSKDTVVAGTEYGNRIVSTSEPISRISDYLDPNTVNVIATSECGSLNASTSSPKKLKDVVNVVNENIAHYRVNPDLWRNGRTDKGHIGVAPLQKEWLKKANSIDRCQYTDNKAEDIKIGRNIDDILFSPKVIRKVVKDEKEVEFESENMKLGLVKLQPKFKKSEACHLPSKFEKLIMSNQSESRTDEDQQVYNLDSIDGDNGHTDT